MTTTNTSTTATAATHQTFLGTSEERQFLALNGWGFLTVGTAWGEPAGVNIPMGGKVGLEVRSALRPARITPGMGAAGLMAAARHEAVRELILAGMNGRMDAVIP